MKKVQDEELVIEQSGTPESSPKEGDETPKEEEKKASPETVQTVKEDLADSSSEVKQYQVQVAEALKDVALARTEMKEAKAFIDAIAEVCETYSAAGVTPPSEERVENAGAEDGAQKQEIAPDLEKQ